MKFNLLEMFEHAAQSGLDGSNLDLIIRSGGGNFISIKNPVLAVPMSTVERLTLMLKKADCAHTYITGDILHINALFNATTTFPAARIYYLKTPYLDKFASWAADLKKHDIDLLKLPIFNDTKFSKIIDIDNYPARFEAWKHKRDSEYKNFNELANGRSKNTSVDKAIWLNTETCFFCKKPADLMHTVSMSNAEQGVMMGVRVCMEHQEKIQSSGGLQATIENQFKLPKRSDDFFKMVADFDSTLAINCQFIREKLACTISEIDGRKITSHRASGVRVIFRLEAIDYYAYNIDYPNGDKHSRVDSADDHSVSFGPDHIHRKLTRKQKNKVESSFTYGQPFLDYKVILELIEDAEKQWLNKNC